MDKDFYVGLDLGQSQDYTALAVVQRMPSEAKDEETGKLKSALHLRHLERYPLRTSYSEVADQVSALMRSEQLTGNIREVRPGGAKRVRRAKTELLVDKTGVGAGVVDLLRERGLKYTSVTITAGENVSSGPKRNEWSVPKKDLVAALEVPFHSKTLRVAEGLELWGVLREELQTFRRKQSLKTSHVSFEHWREADHDDLVLAVALACWGATHKRPRRTLQIVQRF